LADHVATSYQRQRADRLASQLHYQRKRIDNLRSGTSKLAAAAAYAVSSRVPFFEVIIQTANWTAGAKGDKKAEQKCQAALLRCIFGNPYRPITIEASLLTTTVVQLGQGIYEERAFERMPVLGDALEESGIRDAAILRHCREPAPHSKGCHVVDWILKKT
jgi:hypothetical protein